jgi:hypothetical protein
MSDFIGRYKSEIEQLLRDRAMAWGAQEVQSDHASGFRTVLARLIPANPRRFVIDDFTAAPCFPKGLALVVWVGNRLANPLREAPQYRRFSKYAGLRILFEEATQTFLVQTVVRCVERDELGPWRFEFEDIQGVSSIAALVTILNAEWAKPTFFRTRPPVSTMV